MEMAAPEKLRITRQRKAILDCLRGVETHPTADEIYRMVRRRMPKVSLGTVYRNLELLCEHGEILKLELGGSQRRYDGNLKKHYHIRCIQCGRVGDIMINPTSIPESFSVKHKEFDIIGHRLDFQGICQDCKRKLKQQAKSGSKKKTHTSKS